MHAALLSLTLAYTLSPLRPNGDARAPSPTMQETRLNNYVLPGPMSPLGNQVRRRRNLFQPIHGVPPSTPSGHS